MNRKTMKNRKRTTAIAIFFARWTIALVLLLMVSACGVWTSDSQEADRQIRQTEQTETNQTPYDKDVITVELIVDSDGDTAFDVQAEIDARKNPQSVSYDTLDLPYRETFEVSKDAFIPLPSVRLQADAAPDADWISCTILYDGEEVATHLSRGDNPQAVCEKKFRLGPG